jgi:hypothetical protein
MPFAEFLFLAIVVYIVYRFVFNFLIPVVRATNHVRQQFRDMHGTGSQDGFTEGGFGGTNQNKATDPTGSGDANKRSQKPPAEDYIDFEEVK